MNALLLWLGSGFAFAVGIALGAVVMKLVARPVGKTEAREHFDRVEALLTDRNDELRASNIFLERIADRIRERGAK